MGSVSPALRERFQRDWHAATGSACADRALIALSGGPDSTGLLLLMHALSGEITPPCAATIDHRLRATSRGEAEAAADLCRSLGIEHRILIGEMPDRVDRTANLSARARALRYALLADHAERIGARWIVTAHHADDQLETVIMRLNRGAGVGGLAGIRGVSDPIVRPLLGWRRAELAQIVADAGMGAVDDPSNADDRFDRARLRKSLGSAEWLDPIAAARSAAALADADRAIAWMVDRLAAERCRFGDGQAVLDATSLPAELRRRLVERCLRHVDPAITIRGGDLTRLVAALDRLEDRTLGQVRCGHRPLGEGLSGVAFTFRRAVPHRAN